MDWLRWWHGTVTDPKFLWVARKSGQPLASVIAVWAALLECASTATQCNANATRGNVASFDCNDWDVALNLDDGCVARIFAAMEQKGLIEEFRIVAWEKRQPKREDAGNPNTGALSSTERSRLHREKKKREATNGNDMQRNATGGNDRLEEIREEEKHTRVARFDAQAHLESMDVPPEVAKDWLTLRTGKRLKPTQTAFDGVKAEADKAGVSMEDALRTCCLRGWGGFKAEWLTNSDGRINGHANNPFV